MNKLCQDSDLFYNKWLRNQSGKDNTILKLQWLEPSELESVLVTTLRFVSCLSTGKVRLDIRPGKIDISVDDSKEMSS